MNLATLNSYIEKTNPWTKLYGMARSIIAISELLTLFTNPMYYFFNYSTSDEKSVVAGSVSIFRFTGTSDGGLILAKLVMIAILVAVISGYFPQITSILHLWIAYSDFAIMLPSDGGSEVAVVLLALMLPIALTDPRKNHWEKYNADKREMAFKRPLALAFYNIVRVQVAIVYLDAVVQKLPIKDWMNGTAVYYYLNNDMFGMSNLVKMMSEWILTSNLVVVVTYGALITEMVLVFCLVIPQKYRMVTFITGALMHISFAIFIGIPSFSLIMIGALVIYLLPLDYSFNNWLLFSKLRKGKVKNEVI